MWGGPLHNPVFIERILSYLPTLDKSTYGTADRLEGMLTTALEETTLFRVEDQPSVSVSAGAGAAKPNAKRTQPDQNSHNVTSSSPDSPLISAVPPTAQDQHPFYIFPNSLAGTLRCMAPSEASIKGALRHAGFHAVRTHAARGGIKTDAPWEVVWHIMREWIKQKAPVKEGALKEVHAGWRILHAGEHTVSDIEGKKPTEKHELHMDLVKEADGAEKQANGQGEIPTEIAGAKPKKDKVTAASIRFEVVFDEQLGKDKDKKKLKRFQLNPRANWGPMARAK